MKSNLFLGLVSFVLAIATVNAQRIDSKFEKVKELNGVEEYNYTPNGLNVLLMQDNSVPVVTVQIVYRVGSKHEVTGNTGSTHLLEHLMFKGTEKFNKRKGTSIDSKLNRVGAISNATTWNDRTNYYHTLPSDQIELAIEIEADRMRNSLLLEEDKEAEMTVVRNEFEQGENNPYELLNKEIWATAYMAHPYHHSTIGWRSDIENMPIEVLRDFYNTYYWPNNATLTVIGDFEKESLFKMVDTYFGKIGKAPKPMAQPYTQEPIQYGPRQVTVKKPGDAGFLNMSFKTPAYAHKDTPAIQVLAEVLGTGVSSPLSKTFLDTGDAFSAGASASAFKDANLFSVVMVFSPEMSHDSLRTKVSALLEKVKTEGVEQKDIDRVVAKNNAEAILYRDGSGVISAELAETIAGGDWTEYFTRYENLKSVTAADIKRVANTYLDIDQSTTGYFIPETSGGSGEVGSSDGYKRSAAGGKYYYRNPKMAIEVAEKNNGSIVPTNEETHFPTTVVASKQRKRATVAGIDVITVKTGVEDFVSVAASFPVSGLMNTSDNSMLSSLTTGLLSKGTQKRDKYEFSEQLETLGVGISVGADAYNINIGFKCLTKDIPEVIGLLAEELRYPLFDANELELLKEQWIGYISQGITDPSQRGNIAFAQALYPKNHPNYSKTIEKTIEDIKNVTVSDIKAFHKKYFGTAGMHLVAVGDVDSEMLYRELEASFKSWGGGNVEKVDIETPDATVKGSQLVAIPEKSSAQLYIGQYTGLKRSDADYLPFYIANQAFGGGFSGRLMRTVRDEQGLTYGIGSYHSGHTFSGGHWTVYASFGPELFQQGLDATMEQLKIWYDKGVTQQELEDIKSNLQGVFKVGLSKSDALANTLLSLVQRGETPEYIEQFSKEIASVTLGQVNDAIKKYIDLDRLVIVKSGSLTEDGQPMK